MLQTVDVGERSVAAYRNVAPQPLLDELVRVAEDLRGLRVLHVNATPYGGGVSELLRSVVPLMNDLGLVADWKVISGDDAFFQVTKTIHNGLQGARGGLSEGQQRIYVANSEQNARLLEEEYDVVVLHDPQTAALLPLRGRGRSRWVWRCHIDTSQPDPAVWQFLRGYLQGYDAAVFTMAEFVPPDFPIPRVEIVPPAIDPLSPKNLPLPEDVARQVLDWIGMRTDAPLITQVSRFDPWKDPLGVIAAFRLVQREVPRARLALVGSMALDDPEGWDIYQQIQNASNDDPAIHVFTNLTGVGNIEVNAFQRLSNVVVQKSIREGFGFVVSEALWKETPVVAGRVGGIPLQVAAAAGGMSGILVDAVEDTAEAVVWLLQHPDEAAEMAARGRTRVREHFLVPRLLLNELALIADLVRQQPLERQPLPAGIQRDPVCGMALETDAPITALDQAGRRYVFCSELCRGRFLDDPQRYVHVGGSNLPA